MNKPLSVAKYEFENDLIALINNSNLPPFVIEYIMSNTLASVRVASQQQLEQDMKAYKESIMQGAMFNVPVEEEVREETQENKAEES